MADLTGLRILVVEDEPIVAMMLEDMLAELGAVAVGPAGTVRQALELAEAGGFDAALLDVNLNGVRSDAVADTLRAQGMPFVVATGYGVGEDVGFGGAILLQKPYRLDEMAEAVRQAMAAAGR